MLASFADLKQLQEEFRTGQFGFGCRCSRARRFRSAGWRDPLSQTEPGVEAARIVANDSYSRSANAYLIMRLPDDKGDGGKHGESPLDFRPLNPVNKHG